jgi:hypothetical protein
METDHRQFLLVAGMACPRSDEEPNYGAYSMTLRRIADERTWHQQPCLHPEHNPPGYIVLQPGTYEHVCPGCGAKRIIVEQRKSWLNAQPSLAQ